MTAPALVSAYWTGGYTDSLNATCPNGSVGDLLLCLLFAGALQPTTSTTGWGVVARTYSSYSGAYFNWFAKIATDTVGANESPTFTSDMTYMQAYVTRWSGHGVSSPASDIKLSAMATATIDPPNLDAGAVKDWAFIAIGNSYYGTWTGYPTGYTFIDAHQFGGPSLCLAYKLASSVQSENPSTFAGPSNAYNAQTVAIPPAADVVATLPPALSVAAPVPSLMSAGAVDRASRW
jgi:hypothetical protein